MEHNSRLDKEILALRARVQTLDLERKAFLDLVSTHLLLLDLLVCLCVADAPGLAPDIQPYSLTCPASLFPLSFL